jgi:hypothetical protein
MNDLRRVAHMSNEQWNNCALNELKTFWMNAETLADATVAEVVAEHGGRVLQVRGTQTKVELTQQAADEINRRYNWTLS